MAEVHFTSHLRNLIPDGPLSAHGATVGEALNNVLAAQPQLRGYVLDDQGAVRRHVAVYVNGEPVHDRVRMTDPVGAHDEIYVFQALSGG